MLCRHYARLRASHAAPRQAADTWTPPQIAHAYGFPTGCTGKSALVGIIELGGGYQQTDADAFFGSLGLATPAIESVNVAGGKNVPGGDPYGADVEVALDYQLAGGIAPGARYRIYFAPNTTAGFVAAIRTAAHDGCDAISISWGAPESQWSAADLGEMESAFSAAQAAKCTVLCAAGDNGSTDGTSTQAVDYPASSPYVVGCGGTTLQRVVGGTHESVWNDGLLGGATGGGVSKKFGRVAWQGGIILPSGGRGVPDVAGNADPNTGYPVITDGQPLIVGGTSAVAPLYAGLVALCCEARQARVGQMNPFLYRHASAIARDITVGNNGAYRAEPGYDCCTGIGSLRGANVLHAMGGVKT
jgi:kumamolisin